MEHIRIVTENGVDLLVIEYEGLTLKRPFVDGKCFITPTMHLTMESLVGGKPLKAYRVDPAQE